MKKLFWDDPYALRNETVFETVTGREVTLRESVFYAFSGGQESDEGSINGIPVVRAVKSDRTIIYTLAEDHPYRPGDPAFVVIDGARRNRLMRLHFAAEIVLRIFMQTFPGVEKIGAHISPTRARLDFRLAESIKPILPGIQSEAEAIIRRDLPIISAFSDEANERRYWEVPGFGSLPCGGTHPRSTGEVGPIRLTRNNIGKGKERVEISLVDQ